MNPSPTPQDNRPPCARLNKRIAIGLRSPEPLAFANACVTSPYATRARHVLADQNARRPLMHSIIYLIGVIVVILAILSFLGLN